MPTYRAFQNSTRISTAVILKNGGALQVFPFKKEFASMEQWRIEWPQADRFEEENSKASKTLPTPAKNRRREIEMAEFLDVDYSWLVRSVRRIDEETLEVTVNDNSICTVKRSLDFMSPPEITRNSIRYLGQNNWRPALTSIRWMIMLMFVEPDF